MTAGDVFEAMVGLLFLTCVGVYGWVAARAVTRGLVAMWRRRN